MKGIKLTQGYTVLVDDADYEEISRYKWCVLVTSNTQYAMRGSKENGHHKTILMHRQILKAPKNMEVDHINGNGLDNRRCNLRLVTSSQNHFNQRKQQKNTTSRYKGVYWHQRDKAWMVRIQSNGKYRFIGNYATEHEAALAYNQAAIKFHGDYANLNIL
jgi:hypothetical protein